MDWTVQWTPVDSTPLHSTPVMTDIGRLGCGESPVESIWNMGGTDKTSLAAKNIPQHPTPIDVIIYPPCPSLQPMHIISLINFAIYLIIFVFYNLFSAVWTIATTLALFHKSPARTSRQFCSTSLAQVVISSAYAFSMQATTVYFAHFFACHSVFSIIALVLSSKRSLIHLFKGIIALSQPSLRIFALGYISISKASPRPLKPDKGFSDQNSYILAPSCDFATSNRPSALVGS